MNEQQINYYTDDFTVLYRTQILLEMVQLESESNLSKEEAKALVIEKYKLLIDIHSEYEYSWPKPIESIYDLFITDGKVGDAIFIIEESAYYVFNGIYWVEHRREVK